MTASSCAVTRRGDPDAQIDRPRVHDLDHEAGQQHGLGTDGLDARLGRQLDTIAHRQHAKDGWRPTHHAADAVGGGVPRAHLEHILATHPAPDWLVDLTVQAEPDIPEGGCARSPVEVLVGAAHGEVDAPLIEMGGDRSCRMAQIPQDERPGVVGDPRDGGDVRDETRAVRHMAEHGERRPGANSGSDLPGLDPGFRVGLDPAQREATLRRNTFQDIAIRREVVGVEHDLGSVRARRQARPCQLVQQDGGRVRHDGLSWRGADDPGADEVTDGLRPAHPSLIPATDQPGPPCRRDERLHPLGGGRQWSAEGVAVEVGNDALGGQEAAPQVRQRVLGVELFRAVQKPVVVGSHSPTLGRVAQPGVPVSARVETAVVQLPHITR